MRPRVGILGTLIFVLGLVGCSFADAIRPPVTVTIYGQNERALDAWFALMPLRDPPEAVGFGRDSGVACLAGPIGSEIAWFDGSPGGGGRPVQKVGTVVAEGPPGSNVFWVSVASDGSLTTGGGVPAWWVGDAQAC
jgi:hypothetical protein